MNQQTTASMLAAIEAELGEPAFGTTEDLIAHGLIPKRSDGAITLGSTHQLSKSKTAVLVPLQDLNYFLRFDFEDGTLTFVDTFPFIKISLSFRLSPEDRDLPDRFSQFDTEQKDQQWFSVFADNGPLHFDDVLQRFLQELQTAFAERGRPSGLQGPETIWATVVFQKNYPLTALALPPACIQLLDAMQLSIVFDVYAE